MIRILLLCIIVVVLKLKTMNEELIFVQNLIYEFRGRKVMLDFDLARLYHVETRVLNQSVKRNLKRFPADFMFQLTAEEWSGNSSQIVMTSNRPKSALPFAFTEQGVAMLSGLLKSDVAIAANIAIMRAFVQVREYLTVASSVSAELKELKSKVDLIQLQQEENLGAVNDLSEDVRQDIDNLYLAIADLSARIEEKRKSRDQKSGSSRSSPTGPPSSPTDLPSSPTCSGISRRPLQGTAESNPRFAAAEYGLSPQGTDCRNCTRIPKVATGISRPVHRSGT